MQFLTGQWVGNADDGGVITLDISEKNGSLTGKVATYYMLGNSVLSSEIYTWCDIAGKREGDKIRGAISGVAVYSDDEKRYSATELTNIESQYGIEFSESGAFHGVVVEEHVLHVFWAMLDRNKNVGVERSVQLTRASNSETIIESVQMKWSEFKEFVSFGGDAFIYRGQSKNWRLRTSYHRTGESNLQEYFDRKIPDLERNINIVSNHTYDKSNDDSLGALLNLAQHHGYPTPLLDWSRSPYVAAFFAFKDASEDDSKNVIIFMLNEKDWSEFVGTGVHIRSPKTYLHYLTLPAIGNNRVMPQQAVTLYSNADNVEQLIQQAEKKLNQKLISAITLSVTERSKVLKDLSLMGITHASLFPGIDGVCRDLALKHFDI